MAASESPQPPIVRHANHETQWRYMVDAIGEATRVLVSNPPEAVDQVRNVCAERDRLARLAEKVREFFEMRDKFNRYWKHDPSCVGARVVHSQIERIEADMRALVAVGEEVTRD